MFHACQLFKHAPVKDLGNARAHTQWGLGEALHLSIKLDWVDDTFMLPAAQDR